MLRLWFIILSLCSCSAVIYHLNETEYQRMPPVFFLDEYETCLVEEGSSYCMLQLQLYAEPENELMRMINEYSDQNYKHYDHSLIDRGVCVQKTCSKYGSNLNTTLDLSRSLEVCLDESLKREYGLSARLSTLFYCDQYNESRHFDGWDWAVLIGILGIVIISIIGSFYDYNLSKDSTKTLENGNAFLVSFSLMRNWKLLMMTEDTDDKIQNLKFFHGIRVISNLCVLMPHVMMSFTIGFISNPHDIEKSYEISLYHLFYNGLMVVQIFFFISGFLTMYRIQMEEQARTFTPWSIPKIIVLKFIRLLPALAMTLALSTSWVRHFSSGPLWKMYVSGSLVADCRKYWWHHILFLNNYVQHKNFCLIPTWHLSADMQVFLVGVTAYILTGGRTRNLVLGALLLISAALPALHTVLQDLDVVILTPENYRTWRSPIPWYTHTLGHNHLFGFIIGMATAKLLYDWQKNGGHLVQNRWHNLVQCLSLAAIPLTLYSGRAFFQDGFQASLWVRAGYSIAVRMLHGLACATITTSLFSKTSTYLKSFFEWRFWVVPSRLTYCVFLVHMAFVHIMMGIRRQPNLFSFYDLVTAYIWLVVVSYLVSILMYLMVEAPSRSFFKNLVRKHTFQNTTSKALQNKEE